MFASLAFFYTETVLGHEHCWRIIFAIMFPCIKLKGEDCVLKVFMVCIFPATRKTFSVLCRNRRVFREGEICTSTGTSKANNVSFTPSTMKWFEFLFHFLFFLHEQHHYSIRFVLLSSEGGRKLFSFEGYPYWIYFTVEYDKSKIKNMCKL